MSALQTVKLWLVETIGLAKDALHVHVGLILFFGAALAFKWPVRSWKPWGIALAATLIGEAWDIRDTLAAGRPLLLAANFTDLWNTMLWPSAILLIAHTTEIFSRR